MPAINLSRLKLQAAEAAEAFDHPDTLQSKLTDLFEFYSDRTTRPRQSGKPRPVMPAYKVPKSVLDRILFELREHIEADPATALQIADRFWIHRYLEFRLLAGGILSAVPVDQQEEIVKRLISWGETCKEEVLMQLLAEFSERLHHDAKKEHLALLEYWLSSKEQNNQELGLRALHALLEKTDYPELPTVYRLLAPYIQETSTELRPHMLDILRLLAKISPSETAHFLRKRIEDKKTPTSIWLIRRSRAVFPEEFRTRLKLLTE